MGSIPRGPTTPENIMRAECQYICGQFQPVTTSAILTVRRALHKADKTIIFVRPRPRGPDSPFSFAEIKAMWEEAFPTMVSAGVIEIVETDDDPPSDAQVLRWRHSSEITARASLRYNDFFWQMEIPNAVRLAISSFGDEWKDALAEAVP